MIGRWGNELRSLLASGVSRRDKTHRLCVCVCVYARN